MTDPRRESGKGRSERTTSDSERTESQTERTGKTDRSTESTRHGSQRGDETSTTGTNRDFDETGEPKNREPGQPREERGNTGGI